MNQIHSFRGESEANRLQSVVQSQGFNAMNAIGTRLFNTRGVIVAGTCLTAAVMMLLLGASPAQAATYTLTTSPTNGSFTLNGDTLLNGVQGALLNQGTGGTVTQSGGNVIHTFTSLGAATLTIPMSSTGQVLVVGGGGGGGASIGGGGGGGGVVYIPTVTLSGSYSVSVGAGGAAGTTGTASTFSNITAAGGGGGGAFQNGNGASGGSGGGAGGSNGSGTPSGGSANGSSLGSFSGTIYGSRGGNVTASRTAGGGNTTVGRGGGGAGVTDPTTLDGAANSNGGNGGVGAQINIGSYTGLYWGGGGGGGVYPTITPGNGGLGGGGGAANYSTGASGSGGGSALNSGTAGTTLGGVGGAGGANTGGGGGGGSYTGAGGRGGSGIVIVSYAGQYSTGTLTLTGTVDVAATSTLDDAGGLFVVDAAMIGSGGIVKSGTGTVTLSGSNGYSGSTSISAGSLMISNAFALSKSTFAGGPGTLAFGGISAATFGGLSGTSNLALSSTSGGVALSVGANNQSTSYSGALSGSGGLTKLGTGVLTLAAANTHSGATTISAGRLEIGGGGAINSTSGVTVNGAGAEFKYNSATAFTQPLTLTQGILSGTGTINTAVNVGANAIIAPGNSPGIQTYASSVWSPSGAYQWELNALSGSAGTNWDQVAVTTTLDLTGLSTGGKFNLDLITLTGGNTAGPLDVAYVSGPTYVFPIASYGALLVPGSFSTAANSDLTSLFNISLANWLGSPKPAVNDVTVKVNSTGTGLNLVIVPEPATLAMAGIGISVATWALRRRRAA